MKKKVICAMISAVLCCTMLMACGKNETDQVDVLVTEEASTDSEQENPRWTEYDYSSMDTKKELKDITFGTLASDDWSLDHVKEYDESTYQKMIETEDSDVYDHEYYMQDASGENLFRICTVHAFTEQLDSMNTERLDAKYYYYKISNTDFVKEYETLDAIFDQCGKPDQVYYVFNSMEIDYFAYQYDDVTVLFKYYGKSDAGTVDTLDGAYIVPTETFDQVKDYLMSFDTQKVDL